MKKATVILTITAILVLIFCKDVNAKPLGMDSIYPQTFIVVDIDEEADIIYLQTFTNLVYTWEGVEDWEVNDIASAIMYNSGTPETILDDQIAVLEYNGWID